MIEADYVAPADLQQVLQIVAERGPGSMIIAGGTDLVPRIVAGMVAPRLLVDLRRLPLDHISQGDHGLTLGSRVTHSQVASDARLAHTVPALVQACREVGGPPVRNRGTLGGNLANASPAADSAPPLLAYDAEVVFASLDGERVLPLAQFFRGPGATVLRAGDVLVEIRIPIPSPQTAAAFIKLGKRNAMVISVANVAVRVTLDGSGAVAEARIALGAVAPVPLRATAAEALLVGEPLSDQRIAAASQEAARAASPISDVRASAAYRVEMVQVLTARALRTVRQQLTREGAHG